MNLRRLCLVGAALIALGPVAHAACLKQKIMSLFNRHTRCEMPSATSYGVIATDLDYYASSSDVSVTPSSPSTCEQYVQETTYQKRTVSRTQYRTENRQRMISVPYTVPETRQVPYSYTVQVPRTATRTESYSVPRAIVEQQTQYHTVQIPNNVRVK